LNADAPVSSTLKGGAKTALHFAVTEKDVDKLRDLIKAGADATLTISNRRTCLHLAIEIHSGLAEVLVSEVSHL